MCNNITTYLERERERDRDLKQSGTCRLAVYHIDGAEEMYGLYMGNKTWKKILLPSIYYHITTIQISKKLLIRKLTGFSETSTPPVVLDSQQVKFNQNLAKNTQPLYKPRPWSGAAWRLRIGVVLWVEVAGGLGKLRKLSGCNGRHCCDWIYDALNSGLEDGNGEVGGSEGVSAG